MKSPWETLFRKPLADWTWRERWGLRGAALLIGFFSVEVLYVSAWALRGVYAPPSPLLHVWAVVMAGATTAAVEWKRRSRSKADGGAPTTK